MQTKAADVGILSIFHRYIYYLVLVNKFIDSFKQSINPDHGISFNKICFPKQWITFRQYNNMTHKHCYCSCASVREREFITGTLRLYSLSRRYRLTWLCKSWYVIRWLLPMTNLMFLYSGSFIASCFFYSHIPIWFNCWFWWLDM